MTRSELHTHILTLAHAAADANELHAATILMFLAAALLRGDESRLSAMMSELLGKVQGNNV